MEERLPARSQQATLRSIGDERLRDLVERYVRAWEEADVAAITAMLTDGATFSMPPRPSWYRGRGAIGAFLAAWPASRPRRWHHVPVRANGQPALGVYGPDRPGGRHRAHAIEVLTLDGAGQIARITSFHQPAAFARFGLPERWLP